MPDAPLNPDALEAASKALRDDHANRTEFYVVPAWEKTPHESKELFRAKAKTAVSAYLAVAQPEVNSVEEAERLPHMSVILDSEGCAWQRNGHQNGWATWSALGDEFFTSAIDAFPARVLYRPTEEPRDGR